MAEGEWKEHIEGMYIPVSLEGAIRSLLVNLIWMRVIAVLLGSVVMGIFVYILLQGIQTLGHCYIDNSVIGTVTIVSPIVGLTAIASALVMGAFRAPREQDVGRAALDAGARTGMSQGG